MAADSKGRFLKIEKPDLLESGSVLLCSSVVCAKETPREAGGCLSIWYGERESLEEPQAFCPLSQPETILPPSHMGQLARTGVTFGCHIG